MDQVLFVLQLVHYLHNIILNNLAYPNLLGADILRTLWYNEGKLSAILRELHKSGMDAIDDQLLDLYELVA